MRQVVTSSQAKFRPGFVWIAPWMLENAQFQRCKISCHGSVQSLLPAAENILMQIIFGRYFRGLLRNHATRVTRRVQDFQFFWLQWNPGSGIHLFCIESYCCCCCLKDCGQHRVVNRLCSCSPCFRHLWLDSHVNKMDTVKRYKASEINLEGCCGTSRFNWSPLVARPVAGNEAPSGLMMPNPALRFDLTMWQSFDYVIKIVWRLAALELDKDWCFYFRDGRPKFRTTQGTATGLKSVVAPHFNRLSSPSRLLPKTLITASISSLGWPTIRHTICKLKSFLAKWDDTRNKKQYNMECTEANKS